MEHIDKKTALNQGVIIFIFLAVLTALEFFVAIALDAVPILVMVALVKAGLVLYYYMHIYKLNAVYPVRLVCVWRLAGQPLQFAGDNASTPEPDAWPGGDCCVTHLLVLHEPGRDFYGAR